MCRERHQIILREKVAAHAEAAANVAFQHIDGLFRYGEALGENPAGRERRLGGSDHRELIAAAEAPVRDQASRLYAHRGVSMDAELFPAPIWRVHRGDVSLLRHIGHRKVFAVFFEQNRCSGLRHVTICDGDQRIDVDHYGLGGILRESHGVGDDDGDRLADIAHLVDGDDRLLERLQAFQVAAPHRNFRHGAAARRDDVLRGKHAAHARHCTRRRRVDRTDAAVGPRAAHDQRMKHAVMPHVVDIFAVAAHQSQVFNA